MVLSDSTGAIGAAGVTPSSTLTLATPASTDAIDSSPTYTCSLDGEIPGPCPASYTGLVFGSHT